jgi:hypothetical protein
MFAARNGLGSVVSQLVEAGAKPELTDKQGMTALALACEAEQEGIAKMLIAVTKAAGALDAQAHEGYFKGHSAVMIAAARRMRSLVQELVDAGSSQRPSELMKKGTRRGRHWRMLNGEGGVANIVRYGRSGAEKFPNSEGVKGTIVNETVVARQLTNTEHVHTSTIDARNSMSTTIDARDSMSREAWPDGESQEVSMDCAKLDCPCEQ